MRILVAPDDFKGTLSALQAAEAIAAGWHRRCPADDITVLPMSDGGPGFVSVIAQARPHAQFYPLTVRGPLGAPTPAGFLLEGDTAYIESAMACGLHLVSGRRNVAGQSPVTVEGAPELDPLAASTYGVGQLINAARRAGARRIVVGLGGSATTDAGAGMLAALGARAFSSSGMPVRMDTGGAALQRVASVDLSGVSVWGGDAQAGDEAGGIDIVIASDVDSPLLGARGAARGFGPQKGADADQVEVLEAALATFAGAIGRGKDGKDRAVALGSGAAGGLGYGLMLLGGQRVPGIATVSQIVGLDAGIASADLVLTGEGCFDWQSLRGKVVTGVAAAALAQARPVVVIAGRVEVGRRDYAAIGVTAAYAVDEMHAVDEMYAVEEMNAVEGAGQPAGSAARTAAQALADRAARVAGQWGRS